MRKAALFVFLLAVSCGGGTCGGCVDPDYRFPLNDPQRPDAVVQQDVVRVRITQAFLDFIRPQLPELLISQAGSLGDGITIGDDGVLRIPVPQQDLGFARAADTEVQIFLDDLDQRVALNLVESGGIELVMNDLRIGLDTKLKTTFIGDDVSCPTQGDLGGAPPHAAEVTVRATVDPLVGPAPDYALDLDVDVGALDITDFGIDVRSSRTYCAEPECADDAAFPFPDCVECSIFCASSDLLGNLANLLSGLLTPVLNGILAPIVNDLIEDAVAGLSGTSAKFETPLDLEAISGLSIFSRAEPIGVLTAPEPGRLTVNDQGFGLGLELGFDGGLESPAADCVGELEPFVPVRGPTPALTGVDRQGNAYHLGLTLSGSFLNQTLYAAHRGGALCAKLTTEDITELTGGAFLLNASLLSLLASDLNQLAEPAAPAIIELKPRRPATVTLGTGEPSGVDDLGNPVFDWLLQLDLGEIGVAFHVLIQDRFVRVFEVTTDVGVGLNLVVQPDNTLQVALGDISIENFEEQFNELLPNADFAQVLPTLLDVALGAFLSDALVFDLDITTAVSDAIGGVPVTLQINELYRDGADNDYLTLSATFGTAATQALRRSATTYARLHPSEPGLLRRTAESAWQAEPTGAVRLVVGEPLSQDQRAGLEYQLRVDGGLWSIWRPARPDGTLHAPHARLMMPGRHEIEVRARRVDDYRSADLTPERIGVLVDPMPPRINARRTEAGVEVQVRDEESDHLALTLERRHGDGPDASWTPVDLVADDDGARAMIPYGELQGVAQLALRARDSSGNPTSTLVVSLSVPLDEPVAEAPTPSGGAGTGASSCRSVGAGDVGLSWFIVLLGVAFGRRRR